MPHYRRNYAEGGCFFFTLVTWQRTPFFADERHVALLRAAFRAVMQSHPFEIDAVVILPDHLHLLLWLPEGDRDYSTRLRLIKTFVARRVDAPMNERREKQVWQRRFWEHTIRDEEDWRRHVDYVHYNPVKHGYVSAPGDWPHSSFARAVARGWYTPEWGRALPHNIDRMEYE
jgi:putative transposase